MAVYVLIDETRQCCKIGYSKDAKSAHRRVKGLQTASPFGLQVYCINPHLNRSDEQYIHKQLEPYRTGGGKEWFDFTATSVIDCVEQVKAISTTMFPDAVKEPAVETTLPVDLCTCHCTHNAEEDNWNEDVDGCEDCVATWDHNGVCSFCVYSQSLLGEMCESFTDFLDRCDEISTCEYVNPAAWTLRHYFNADNTMEYQPIAAKDCFQWLIDCSCSSQGNKCRVADLVYRLSKCIWDKNYDEIDPCLYKWRGNIVVVFEGDFSETIEDAEELYIDCFFDVDECGTELFVSCVNKAREVKEVPYGIWKD